MASSHLAGGVRDAAVKETRRSIWPLSPVGLLPIGRGEYWHARSVFEGFQKDQIDVGEASVFVRHGGDGPPVVLLPGHPRTSATWHRVAPQLIQRGFTVVCPDLRGYGQPRAPAPTPDHTAHSKRAARAGQDALVGPFHRWAGPCETGVTDMAKA